MDVFLSADDVDGDYLSYSVIDNGGMNISVSNNILSVTPPENYFGQTNISVSVSDGEIIDTTSFTLTVNAVNDAPIVSQPLADLNILEDAEAVTMVLSEVFTDIDGDILSYTVFIDSICCLREFFKIIGCIFLGVRIFVVWKGHSGYLLILNVS